MRFSERKLMNRDKRKILALSLYSLILAATSIAEVVKWFQSNQ
jgi:hypothetical protein